MKVETLYIYQRRPIIFHELARAGCLERASQETNRQQTKLAYELYPYLYLYGCGCTRVWYWVRVFSWGTLQQQHQERSGRTYHLQDILIARHHQQLQGTQAENKNRIIPLDFITIMFFSTSGNYMLHSPSVLIIIPSSNWTCLLYVESKHPTNSIQCYLTAFLFLSFRDVTISFILQSPAPNTRKDQQ